MAHNVPAEDLKKLLLAFSRLDCMRNGQKMYGKVHLIVGGSALVHGQEPVLHLPELLALLLVGLLQPLHLLFVPAALLSMSICCPGQLRKYSRSGNQMMHTWPATQLRYLTL